MGLHVDSKDESIWLWRTFYTQLVLQSWSDLLSFEHAAHLPWVPTPTVAQVCCPLLLPVMILRLFWISLSGSCSLFQECFVNKSFPPSSWPQFLSLCQTFCSCIIMTLSPVSIRMISVHCDFYQCTLLPQFTHWIISPWLYIMQVVVSILSLFCALLSVFR